MWYNSTYRRTEIDIGERAKTRVPKIMHIQAALNMVIIAEFTYIYVYVLGLK